MKTPSKSYRSVAYDLRPAKQVERRMILDALGRLMNEGMPVRDYQYTGFGSIYFFDFLLFYKLVGMRKFLSVEYDKDIEQRVKFNKPFDQIDIRMDPIGDVIPDLSKDQLHILWLDYDDRLLRSMLEDTAAAAYQLPPGSMLLVTVDAEPPKGTSTVKERQDYYTDQSGDFLPFEFNEEWCTLSKLAETNLRILESALRNGLSARSDVDFHPIFRFVYADGHEMVTLGGVIGGEKERRLIDACDWNAASYLRRDSSAEPYRISVPRLTRKERLHLDYYMPCPDGWCPTEFEIEEELLHAYRDIHRFYPHYGEFIA